MNHSLLSLTHTRNNQCRLLGKLCDRMKTLMHLSASNLVEEKLKKLSIKFSHRLSILIETNSKIVALSNHEESKAYNRKLDSFLKNLSEFQDFISIQQREVSVTLCPQLTMQTQYCEVQSGITKVVGCCGGEIMLDIDSSVEDSVIETADVSEIIDQFRAHKPPYVCPVDDCRKATLGLMSLKQHLLRTHKDLFPVSSFNSPPGSADEHEESLLGADADVSSQASDSVVFGVSRTPHTGGKRNKVISSKLRRKKRSRYVARKQVRASFNKMPPSSPPSPSQRAAHAGMTYEESLRSANFEIDGHSYRVSVDQPLPLSFVDDDAISFEGSPAAAPQLEIKNDARASKKKTLEPQIAASFHTKLPEVEWKPVSNYVTDIKHVVPAEYRIFVQKTDAELDAEIEYIMDDVDYSWLAIVNNEQREPRCLKPVTVDEFELLMDRLEKECHFESRGRHASAGGGDDDEAVCSICQDGEASNTNVILFCDMCNLPVHQECYGVPYIPEGQWICRRCLLSPSNPVSCQLCPIKTGAFKQTTKGKWAHVACALWIPEVQFANPVFLEPIENIENIPSARFKLPCYICKKRNAGACIQCSKQNCFTAFHISCGQSVGLHIKLEPVKDPEHSPALVNVKKLAFCDVHTPNDSDRCPMINTNTETGDSSESQEERKRNTRKVRKNLAQKQSGNINVCLPEISVERYEAILCRVNFEAKVQFMNKLMKYWLLKRQARNGVPLIKRLQMTHLQKQQQRASSSPNDATGVFVDETEKEEPAKICEDVESPCERIERQFELLCQVSKCWSTDEEHSTVVLSPHEETQIKPEAALEQMPMEIETTSKSTNESFLERSWSDEEGKINQTIDCSVMSTLEKSSIPLASNERKVRVRRSYPKKRLNTEEVLEAFHAVYDPQFHRNCGKFNIKTDTIDECVNTFKALRHTVLSTKKASLYYYVLHGQVLTVMRDLLGNSQKRISALLTENGVKLESTQRNNFISLYHFSKIHPQICCYALSTSFIFRHYKIVKEIFEQKLLS